MAPQTGKALNSLPRLKTTTCFYPVSFFLLFFWLLEFVRVILVVIFCSFVCRTPRGNLCQLTVGWTGKEIINIVVTKRHSMHAHYRRLRLVLLI